LLARLARKFLVRPRDLFLSFFHNLRLARPSFGPFFQTAQTWFGDRPLTGSRSRCA
jgi:hypothetical protein